MMRLWLMKVLTEYKLDKASQSCQSSRQLVKVVWAFSGVVIVVIGVEVVSASVWLL